VSLGGLGSTGSKLGQYMLGYLWCRWRWQVRYLSRDTYSYAFNVGSMQWLKDSCVELVHDLRWHQRKTFS